MNRQNELVDALTNMIDDAIRAGSCSTYDEWQTAVERVVISHFKPTSETRLISLCRELYDELDGVRIPKSAAAVCNGIRAVIEEIDG